jgi:RNA polymerase sigma factor (sigma-70 family)
MGKSLDDSETHRGSGAAIARLCQHQVLGRLEERELLSRYLLHGDLAARDRLISCNQKFIVMFVRQTVPTEVVNRIGLLDIVNEANLGFMRAIDNYSLDTDARLMTYAVWWVSSYVSRYTLSYLRVTKVSEQVAQLWRQKKRRETRQITLLGNEGRQSASSCDDVALIMAFAPPKDLHGTMSTSDGEKKLISDLISGTEESVETTVGNSLHCKLIRERWERIRILFTERERTVVERHLMADEDDAETLESLGARFGISRERIRQIEDSIIMKLRLAMADLVE